MKLYGIRNKETKQPLNIHFEAQHKYFDKYDYKGFLCVITQLTTSPYVDSIWLINDKSHAVKMLDCIGGNEFYSDSSEDFYIKPGICYELSKHWNVNKEDYEVFEVHQL
jgi:hypothetical protein